MKRILALVLITTLLISISGCVAKSDHARLLKEKASVEKNYDDLRTKEEELRVKIAARQQDIRDLRVELRTAKTKIRNLDVQLSESKAEVAEFKK